MPENIKVIPSGTKGRDKERDTDTERERLQDTERIISKLDYA
jgi:hypothetical protein